MKLGDVGILAPKDAREKATDILAKRQINAAKNKPTTVYEPTRLLTNYLSPTYKGKTSGR